MAQKTTVRYRIKAEDATHRSERPPADCWSWRKYGQKPIKGSPYPRNYYRCSTFKGCSAKKQVERCRTDASMLIITYTSSHTHPGPDLPSNLSEQLTDHPQSPSSEEDHAMRPKKQSEQDSLMDCDEDVDQDSPLNNSQETAQLEESPPGYSTDNANQDSTCIEDGDQDSSFHNSQYPIIIPQEGNLETGDSPKTLITQDPLSSNPLGISFPTPKEEENDFYDELEELPTYSSLSGLTRSSNLFEEKTLVNPS